MKSLRYFFYCIVVSLSTAGDAAQEKVLDRTWQKAGTVLLSQDFEQGLAGWIALYGEGDTPNSPSWELVTGIPGHGGMGFARCFGYDPANYNCIPKNKYLQSPEFQAGGYKSVVVSYYRRFLAPRRELKNSSETVSIVNPVSGKTTSLQVLSNPFPSTRYGKMTEDWELYTVLIPSATIAESAGRIKLLIQYTSSEAICDTLEIDDLMVQGFLDDAPDTVITRPVNNESHYNVGLNELIEFEAQIPEGSAAAETFIWGLYHEGEVQPFVYHKGSIFNYSFEERGNFVLRVVAKSADGNLDPTPAVLRITATNALNLNTLIAEPVGDPVRVLINQNVHFNAEAEGTGGQEIHFIWRVEVRGPDPRQFSFERQSFDYSFMNPGRYEISCQAMAEDGIMDPTPARIMLVVDVIDLRITSPERPSGHEAIILDLNETLSFQGSVNAPEGVVAKKTWKKNGNELSEYLNSDTCQVTFDKRGEYWIEFQALDSENRILGGDAIRFSVDTILSAKIIGPEGEAPIEIHQPFSIHAEVSGKEASQASYKWIFQGNVKSTTADLSSSGIATAGRYPVTLQVRSPGQPEPIEDHYLVNIVDPNASGGARIVAPRTDKRILPGETVYCEARIDDPSLSENNIYWNVVYVGTGEVQYTANALVMGNYSISSAGNYECQLYKRTANADVLLDKRLIFVSEEHPDGFAGNETFENAALAPAGSYASLDLTREQYYQIEVPSDYLSIRLRVEIPAPAHVVFYNLDGSQRFRKLLNESKTLTIENLKAGVYTWGIQPIPSDGKKDLDLNFGFSIDVLNPGLYFADITQSTSFSTSIGMVNTTNEASSVDIVAIGADGSILGKISTSIPAQGKYKDSVSNLFPDVSLDVSWIRVDSTVDLVGYSWVVSQDALEAYGTNAAKHLAANLLVPHIATDTNTWYTKANVVNGSDSTMTAKLFANAEERDLENNAAFNKESLDFLEKFNGSLPGQNPWGNFKESNGKATLVGNEVFGRVREGENQIVGLSLSEAPSDNPSFATSTNTLYFTHIARNIGKFWTGLALVNIEDFEQSAIVRGYGSNGLVINDKIMVLEPQSKTVLLAEDFLEGIGSPADVDWVEVKADSGIVGYELFGTWDSKQLSGIEAIYDVKKDVCFSFIDATGVFWHGYSVINATDEPNEVSFSLMNSEGEVIGSPVVKTLLSKEKKIFLYSDLFGEVVPNASWIKVAGTKELAGFELFGTDDHMSGIIAQ